ncbi:MAG: thioredoxin family protein [Saprospiraceae bacterium]|nr:thioredoxin family protein [Saprospiraceae bacterium]
MKKILGLGILLFAAAGIFMAATSTVDFGLTVGDKAPDFKLKNIDGKYYSLKDVKDANGKAPKGYIVTFTCNTCPYAVMYEDRIAALHDKMAPKGYPVVAIMPNDTEIKPDDSLEKMAERAKDKNFNFLYLIDEKQEVFPQYGASRTPEVYLLDSDMVLRYTGAIDDNAQNPDAVKTNYVEEAVAAMEAGKEPSPAKTKAIGCTIKVKR